MWGERILKFKFVTDTPNIFPCRDNLRIIPPQKLRLNKKFVFFVSTHKLLSSGVEHTIDKLMAANQSWNNSHIRVRTFIQHICPCGQKMSYLKTCYPSGYSQISIITLIQSDRHR